ncbi:MAG TPA: cold shock domain-containing protein [Pedobacter sp.]|jgi:cold shock CspA family protein
MAKSSETFNKKEKEKKRLKKAKDKLEKAQDRKENAIKGKSLEEMFAYVDENGNITSTPPDATKKRKEINSEDIQIGVARQEAIPHDTVRKGIVSMFNESKGFGFIRDLETQESIFFHINGLIDPVKEGSGVSFETEVGQKGLNAIKVKKT